jgi:hypothetical protein
VVSGGWHLANENNSNDEYKRRGKNGNTKFISKLKNDSEFATFFSNQQSKNNQKRIANRYT